MLSKKNLFRFPLILLSFLVTSILMADTYSNQPENQNPEHWHSYRTILLKLTGPSWSPEESNNTTFKDTFFIFLQKRLTQVLQSQLFQNYADLLIRRYFNCSDGLPDWLCNPSYPPNYDPNDFTLTIPTQFSSNWEYVNYKINWWSRPFLDEPISLPQLGRVYLRVWFQNWSDRGGTFGGIDIPDWSANPASPIITFEHPENIKIYIYAGQGYDDQGHNYADGIVVKLIIPSVKLEIVMGPPISYEWNGYSEDEEYERISNLDKFVRATASIKFDLSVSLFLKVISYEDYASNSYTSFDLGKIGIFFTKVDFDLANFRLDDFNAGPLAYGDYPGSYWGSHSGGISPLFIYRKNTNTGTENITSPGYTPNEVKGIFLKCGYCDKNGKFYPLLVTVSPYKVNTSEGDTGYWWYDNGQIKPDQFCKDYYNSSIDWTVYHGGNPSDMCGGSTNVYLERRIFIDRTYFTSTRVMEFLPYIEGEIRGRLEAILDDNIRKYEGSYILVDLNDPDGVFAIKNLKAYSDGGDSEKDYTVYVTGVISLSDRYLSYMNDIPSIGWQSNVIISGSQPSDLPAGGTSAEGLFWYTGFGFSLRREWSTVMQTDSVLNQIRDGLKAYGLVDGWGDENSQHANDNPSWVVSNGQVLHIYDHDDNEHPKYNYLSGLFRLNKIYKTFGPAYADRNFASSEPYPYMIGIGIHQNLMNIVLSVLNDYGVTKFELNRDRQSSDTMFFNTLDWKSLFPNFYKKYHYIDSNGKEKGYPIMIRFIPGFAEPNASPDYSNTVPHIVVGGETLDDKIETSHYSVYPDLTLSIPNLYVEFYVWHNNSWEKVFSILDNMRILFSVELGRNLMYNSGGYVIEKTNFPIGCGVNGIPCEVINADTKRVLYLGVAIKSQVKSVFPAPDMPSSITEKNANLTDEDYNEAIANIVGMLLNSEFSLNGEAVFDIGALLDLPVSVTAVTIGPSWQYFFYTEDNKCVDDEGNYGFDHNGDYDDNCYGDYFIAALNIEEYMGDFLPKYVIRMIDNIINERPFNQVYDYNYTPQFRFKSSSPVSETFNVHTIKAGKVEKVNYFLPEVESTKVDPMSHEVIVTVTGSDYFSYKLDNGTWSPFMKADSFKVKPVFAGLHTIYIRGKNRSGGIAPDIVKRDFYFDPYKPIISDFKVEQKGNYALISFNVIEDSRYNVTYSIDEGPMKSFSEKDNKLKIEGSGAHTLRLKVIDQMGNMTDKTFKVVVESEGFGCSNGDESDFTIWTLIFFMLVFTLLRRKVISK